MVPTPVTTPREVAGVVWQVAEGGPVRGAIEAGAIIGDTYVTIRAPGDAHFARVAAGLRRVAP